MGANNHWRADCDACRTVAPGWWYSQDALIKGLKAMHWYCRRVPHELGGTFLAVMCPTCRKPEPPKKRGETHAAVIPLGDQEV